jgi:hypothetical protein
MRQTFARALKVLDEERFQELYGSVEPLVPEQVAELLAGSGVRWFIAGGRAARVGARARRHNDTDVVIALTSLRELRRHLADWDLWEAHEGTLRPLLPGDRLSVGREQLWARRSAQQPWELDVLLHPWGPEWKFKKDPRVRVPWERALHDVGGVTYLRPEIALLHKAHLNRPKDRDDLAAARLGAQERAWLTEMLEMLGYEEWARLARG